MQKYKRLVTDYEGMQAALDTHAAQGWRLASLTPATWRKSSPGAGGMDSAPFESLSAPQGDGDEAEQPLERAGIGGYEAA